MCTNGKFSIKNLNVTFISVSGKFVIVPEDSNYDVDCSRKMF